MARNKGGNLTRQSKRATQINRQVKNVEQDFDAKLEYESNKVWIGALRARTENQAQLIHLLHTQRIVVAIGPSGTGKTFTMTSYAAEALERGDIDRIVITRPQVDCDEKMGFLPGTEDEKFAAWLNPFMDVLEGKLGKSRVATLKKYGKLAASPLSTMRGTTFRRTITILDEAQNTTPGQMKMFLTRIGEGSKLFIDGDLEQSDLPLHVENGLSDAVDILPYVPNSGILEFSEDDVVRDPTIRALLKAYRNRYIEKRKAA